MNSVTRLGLLIVIVIIQLLAPAVAAPSASWTQDHEISFMQNSGFRSSIAISNDGSNGVVIWRGPSKAQAVIFSIGENTISYGSISDVAQSTSDIQNIKISSDGTRAITIIGNQLAIGAINGSSIVWRYEQITQPIGIISDDQLAFASDGRKAIAVWDFNTGSSRIIKSLTADISDTAINWSIASATSWDTSAQIPKVALSRDGTKTTAIWTNYRGGVSSASATINGITTLWGREKEITTDRASNPNLALSDNGNKALVVFTNNLGKIGSAVAEINGYSQSWGNPIEFSTNSGDFPIVSLSGDGAKATAVWIRTDGHASPSPISISSSSAVIGQNTAAWGGDIDVFQATDFSDFSLPLALSKDGSRGIVSWRTFDGLNYVIKAAPVGVEVDHQLWGDSADIAMGLVGPHKLAMSGDGSTASIVWNVFEDGVNQYHPNHISFAKIVYDKLLTVQYNNNGTITSNPSGIDCGNTCSASFNSGTSVTLTATPNSGYTFSGWSGACTGAGSCVVTMNSNQSVGASFALSPYLLSVSSAGNGSITSNPSGIDCGNTCSASFNSGTSVTLTATPNSGYTFSGWSGACTGAGSCVVTMNSNQSVGASFTPIPIYKNLTVNKTGSGSVLSSPSGISCGSICNSYYLQNTPVTLFATPAQGYVFSHWSGACVGIGGCTVSMYSDQSVTATFTQAPNVTLSASVTGKGSIADFSGQGINCGSACSFSYPINAMVTLVALPQVGNTFTGWGGGCTGRGDCTLWMGANQSVSGTFLNTYILIQPAIQLLLQ